MLRRISRTLLRRLDRVVAVVDGWKAAREAQHEQLQARDLFVGLLRAGLRDAGIDPATVPALRRFDTPDPPVDPPIGRRRPAAPNPFFAKIAELARRCRQHPPPLAMASPMELFAMYCFDENVVSQETGG